MKQTYYRGRSHLSAGAVAADRRPPRLRGLSCSRAARATSRRSRRSTHRRPRRVWATVRHSCTLRCRRRSTRDRGPDYARKGGHYDVAFHRYHDPDATYSFDRVDLTAIQHIPILRETWVVSLRARLETTVGDDSVVPYFCCRRSAAAARCARTPSWRFRDRHALLDQHRMAVDSEPAGAGPGDLLRRRPRRRGSRGSECRSTSSPTGASARGSTDR